jgi:hypothetical protein
MDASPPEAWREARFDETLEGQVYIRIYRYRITDIVYVRSALKLEVNRDE